jgi:excisionase family DNA binding protein
MFEQVTGEITLVKGRPTKVRTYGLPAVLTVAEAAAFLRLNIKTVYAAISTGELPGRKVCGRTVVLRDAMLEWLRSKAHVSSRDRRS